MAKLTLTDIANLTNEQTVITAINANNALIEAAMEKTLTRDDNTSNPNAMSVDLQMGGKKITNLGTPTAATDAVTKAYVDAASGNDIGDISSAVSAAQAAAQAAAVSAGEAADAADGFYATSSTSTSVATGSKTFTIETNKSFDEGMYVMIVDDAAPTTNWMHGQVTAYNSGTGALDVTVETIAGSGTLSDWLISVSGPRGATGSSGSGSGDVTTAANFPASGRLVQTAGTDKSIDETSITVSTDALSGISTLAATSTITSTSTGSAFAATGSGASIEIGAVGSSNTPKIDFHSSSSSTDYDARLIASGGTSSAGAGTLTLTAATFAVSGEITEGGNPVINTAGGDNLSGGFTTTSYAINGGVLDEGDDPWVVNPLDGYIQHYTNEGAHDLLEPTAPCVVIIQVTNGTGSGTIDISDFDKQTGDTLTTTQGHVFELTIRKLTDYSLINVLRIA
jgi:hypothetical protein